MDPVSYWYLVGILSLLTFILINLYYFKGDQSGAFGPILGMSMFFIILVFFVKYIEIDELSCGYTDSMFNVLGVPISMIFISLGAGSISGSILWEVYLKREKSVNWISALLLSWGTFGFTLYILHIPVSVIFWIIIPWAILGIYTIVRYKRSKNN